MVSCFRTVPSRLCCSNYLKSSTKVHLDVTNISPVKITSVECAKQNNYCFQIGTISNISTHKDSFSNSQMSINQNTLVPFPSSDLTSQNIVMWCRRENGLLQTSPINNESFKNTLLLANTTKSQNAVEPSDSGRPSNEQLEKAFLVLSDDLPHLFVRPFDYSIFNKDVILENNIKGTRHEGIGWYALQVSLLKAAGHFRFASVRFIVLKITKHPEDGTIKCRWRIQGIGGLKAVAAFFSSLSTTKLAAAVNDAPVWYDGFSIYYLNSNGQIYKHVIDKMQPDDDKIVEEKPAITKLAMFLGLDHNKNIN